jgi:HD-GYP domain-containing protein (c-di-GMP phosphodiesterase class II)
MDRMASGNEPGVRLAELVAALSLPVDLGLGQPMEHNLRQTLIALRLAETEGLSRDERAAIYYVSLLSWVGCVVDSHQVGAWFGDESALAADAYRVDRAGLPAVLFVARRLGAGRSPLRRLSLLGEFVVTGGRSIEKATQAQCEATGELADRLGFGPAVREPLLQAFERFDGKGSPGQLGGERLAPAIRIVQLADVAEVFHRLGGVEAAVAVARARRGTQFDPGLVDRFCGDAADVLGGLAAVGSWKAVIDAEPQLGRVVSGAELDAVLEALGDFADLKSPCTLGHARGVAELVTEAARRLGLPAGDVVVLRRAALVHHLGNIGIPSSIWDNPHALSDAERERLRTHPYLAERTLSHSPALAGIGVMAGLHHERLDGSGYPRGLAGAAIPMTARVLAAADVYHALTEPRPHRPAQPAAEAEQRLRAEVGAGRLDGDAVGAVLAAAGHRVRRRTELPHGLTAREVEVLVLLARGYSNPRIAERLGVSRKTVGAHLEHIYTKLGVSTRTEAALFAMRHGLLTNLAES